MHSTPLRTKFFLKHSIFFAEVHLGRHLLAPLDENTSCTPAAINEFPPDGFTRTQRQKGWIILHMLLVCYLFTLLAVVCDDYFVPAIKKFCDCNNFKQISKTIQKIGNFRSAHVGRCSRSHVHGDGRIES